jgi:hypothetical protein
VQLNSGGEHTHHHSVLAGVGAGTAGVLVAGLMILAAWRTISHTVSLAVTVILWALVAAVIAVVAAGITYLFLRLRHHILYPETLTRHAIRAEVIRAEVIPAEVVAGRETPALPVAAPVAANGRTPPRAPARTGRATR